MLLSLQFQEREREGGRNWKVIMERESHKFRGIGKKCSRIATLLEIFEGRW